MTFPKTRLRRLRQTPALRALVKETTLSIDDFILPLFIEEGIESAVEMTTLPGVMRWPEAEMDKPILQALKAGLKAILLFGVSHCKDDVGSDSWNDNGLLARMITRAKAIAPDMIVIADTCFCEYTSHGHCGVVCDGIVDNDKTLKNLIKQAVCAARAGADIIAPSAMMDGQIAALRDGLDDAGFIHVPLMSYSTKFASPSYGPFREAAGCDLKGDRKQYQMDYANGREALVESLQDEIEGADILMVKPGLPYLDVLARLRERTLLPLAVYHISGEYAQLKFAAKAGAIDENLVLIEHMTAFKRAGANMIITYAALQIAELLNA